MFNSQNEEWFKQILPGALLKEKTGSKWNIASHHLISCVWLGHARGEESPSLTLCTIPKVGSKFREADVNVPQ